MRMVKLDPDTYVNSDHLISITTQEGNPALSILRLKGDLTIAFHRRTTEEIARELSNEATPILTAPYPKLPWFTRVNDNFFALEELVAIYSSLETSGHTTVVLTNKDRVSFPDMTVAQVYAGISAPRKA